MPALPPVQEVRAPNARLLEFLRRPECVEALLRYAVLPPPPATPDAAAAALRRSKYPQAACEVCVPIRGQRRAQLSCVFKQVTTAAMLFRSIIFLQAAGKARGGWTA